MSSPGKLQVHYITAMGVIYYYLYWGINWCCRGQQQTLIAKRRLYSPVVMLMVLIDGK